MAKIMALAEQRLPLNGDVALSDRSLPRISRKLHEEIYLRVCESFEERLSWLTRAKLEKAVNGSPVIVTAKNRITLEVIILEVSGSEVKVRLTLPLRGSAPEVRAVVQRLLRPTQILSGFQIADGAIDVLVELPTAPVEVRLTLSGSNEKQIVWMTFEEGRGHYSLA